MMKNATTGEATAAHTLLQFLFTTDDLSGKLRMLHSLALYESGDTKLGRDEKDALLDCEELAKRLDLITDQDKSHLLDLL